MARRCPQCQTVYGDSIEICPADDSPLEAFDPDDDPYVGTVVDERFRLDALLGAGGMGRVYRGTQLSVDRPVAVKLLRGEAVPDRLMKERFFREARVISGFSHPNIIRLIEFGNDPEHEFPYLVMELAGGLSLAELIGAGRLHPKLAVEIARQVCSGLLEAHDANIVHRDLKPDNLHLIANSDGSFLVKILDFGIAFPQDASKNLTATGMMCGTATYVSPEQARSSKVDGQSDLYSLGVILFEMLTGILPFRGDSGFEIIMKQVQEPPPDIRQDLPEGAVPDRLIELVYELLEKEPRRRPPGARRVRDRLDAIAETIDVDLQHDVDREGIQQFERWLLPAVPEGAPIHESDTLAAEEEPGPEDAEPLDPSLSHTQTVPADETGSETDGASDAGGAEPLDDLDDAASQRPASPAPSETSAGASRTLLAAVAVLFALLAVLGGVYILGDWGAFPGEEQATRGSAPGTEASNERLDGSSERADATARAALQPISGPLQKWAGRCVVVGTTEADFHTIYFYPEVGELLLRGDDRLWWSPLEVAGRRDERVFFEYRPRSHSPEETAELAASGSVRSSADKRMFRLRGSGEFVCRRETYSAYYTDLDLEGEWRAEEAGRTLSFPDAGQRFSVDAADGDEAPGTSADAGGEAPPARRTFVYRLLDGAPDARTQTLAVRPAGSDQRWKLWQLERAPEDDRLTIRRGTSDSAPPTAYRRGENETEEPRALSNSQNAEVEEHDGPSPSPQPTEPSSAAAGSSASAPSPAPALSDETDDSKSAVDKTWQRRHERIVEKCRSAYRVIQENSQHQQKLLEQDKHEEAREFTETLRRENEKASKRMRKAGEQFSALVQEMATAGVAASRIQKMSAQFSAACQGK